MLCLQSPFWNDTPGNLPAGPKSDARQTPQSSIPGAARAVRRRATQQARATLSSSKPPRAGQAPMLLSHQNQPPTPCLRGSRVCKPLALAPFQRTPQHSSRHAALQAHMQRQRDIKLASSSYSSTSTPHTARPSCGKHATSTNRHFVVTPPLPAKVLSPVRPISAAATHQIDTQKHLPRSLPASAQYQSPSPHPGRACPRRQLGACTPHSHYHCTALGLPRT